MCELSGSFVVTTRTAGQPVATKLTYDRRGKLISQEPAAHPVGTTVTLIDLFSPLPVRRQDLLRHAKKHYAKALRALQAYAVVASGVRLSVSQTDSKGKRSSVLSTQGAGKLGGAVANVFGAKFFQELQPIKVDIRDDDDEGGGDGGDGEVPPSGDAGWEPGSSGGGEGPRRAPPDLHLRRCAMVLCHEVGHLFGIK